MFDTLKADFARYYELLPSTYGPWRRFVFFMSCQGMWALLDYRFRKWLQRQCRLVRLLFLWPSFFFHIWVETVTGISLPTGCEIGKGLYIGHFSGIFVHDSVVMGESCSLSQGVTIGLGGKGVGFGPPTVGSRVYFGAGAKAFGKITIGDGSAIGANAVVVRSVPAGATAVGVPAHIIDKESRDNDSDKET